MFPIDPIRLCGLNGNDLADKTGYSKAQVSMLLNGKRQATISAVVKFHVATDGKISLKQLRPDIIAALKKIGYKN